MSLISDLFIGILVPMPIYVILASHSLRYYVAKSNISEIAIELFLNKLYFPLRAFFTEQTGYNLFTNDIKSSVAHFLLTNASPIPAMRLRLFWASFGVIFILSIGIGMTKQTVSVHVIQYAILFVENFILLYWAWNFGSKLTRMEAELHQ